MNKDNKIIIRYDAYPYERFGTYKATIKEISQSIITDDEEEKPILIGEPYYKITAELDKQSVKVYGAEKTTAWYDFFSRYRWSKRKYGNGS
ncbi:hypothetical protein [Legionella tunisiensis]|uniref:hypothetical protein n=1 Tax=Legionella tunisiensis TaxID=1034944 RepID=UPI0002EBDA57|nr:hypothetical protein [Legionella tunisiensis]